MGRAKDVDDYIANASDVARPILVGLRRIFQQASPKLEEVIKWGVPCYEYKGPVAGLAAYKNHVTWGLWKASLLDDPDGLIGNGILKGGKIASVADIPPSAKLTRLIKQAIALNEAGVKPVTPEPDVPEDLADALKANDEATRHWANFTPARRWQYVNWITKAKRAETRAKRVASAALWVSVGKTMK